MDRWKAAGLDLAPILREASPHGKFGQFEDQDLRSAERQDHGLDKALDNELIEIARPALESREPVRAQLDVRNVNRTVGTMLGHEVARRYRAEGLPEGTIDLTLLGSAGQSFGAFLPRRDDAARGRRQRLRRQGALGGRLVIRPDRSATFRSEEQIIAGDTIAYGATSGEIFARGGVGERCCVRDSGATVVTEGVGDHGCEYMTSGRVVVLGKTGRNFAAGMSGGYAFVLRPQGAPGEPELVELGPVGGDKADELADLVRRFTEETGSEVARRLLNELACGPRAVHARDAARTSSGLLDVRAEAEREGLDEDQANARIMEVLHG